MRLLLDSHTLIWFYDGDTKLSVGARAAIQAPGAEVFVSLTTVWELGIKVSIGKLTFAEPYPDFLKHSIDDNGFRILPVERRHVEGS